MIEFDVQFQNAQNMDVSFSESDTFSCSMDGVIVSDYPGPYEVEPTENTQSLITSGKILASDITVDAIPSDYVGSSIPHRSSDDLNASGDTISAPAGYYDEVASKPIAHGLAKTPDSTISVNPSISVNSAGLITATVSKNITITPTVTPGYIDTGTSGTITENGADTKQLTTQAGSTITPTESEQTAVAEGKFTTGDVKVGAISSTYVGSDIPRKGAADLTASGATVTAPAGYYESQATKSVATGTATAPTTISGSQATLTTGTNTITLQKTLNVTPRITTAGYISAGTAGSALVSLNANVTTKAATTIYPSASDQTIASGTYTTGAQTIKGVTTSNILAANIKQGVVVTVGDSDDADRILSVTGTYSGGGGGGASVGTKTITNSDATATSISFEGLEGTPIAFFVRCTTSLSRSSSYRHYYVATMRYNGTNTDGNRWYRYNGQFSNITSGYYYTYSGGTLTLSSSGNQTTSPGSFYNGTYELVYIY